MQKAQCLAQVCSGEELHCVAGSEPAVSSWRSSGCLIGMLDQVLNSVLRQL